MPTNEFFFKKLETFAWEIIVTSLFCTIANLNKRKFIIAIVPDTRSIREPRAFLQLAFYLVNFQGFVAPYPRAHLPVAELITYDILLESQAKKIDSKSVL